MNFVSLYLELLVPVHSLKLPVCFSEDLFYVAGVLFGYEGFYKVRGLKEIDDEHLCVVISDFEAKVVNACG